MILLDLFAGIGGFSYAAHQLGWTTAAFVEKDVFCQKVLRKNFPGVEIFDDIFTFRGESFRGRCDVITGGFPCQPFSQAGKREGSNDERFLFPEMLRIISEVRPLWVVAENVRGLLSIESGEVFEEIAASLERLGYSVTTFCIPACAVAAPHRRDRLWIIAHSDRFGKHSGRRETQGPNGEVPERNDDAESGNANLGSIADSDHKRRIGRGESGKDRKRPLPERCGNDRSFGEPSINNCELITDPCGEQNSPASGRSGGHRKSGRNAVGTRKETTLEIDGQANSDDLSGRGEINSDANVAGLQRRRTDVRIERPESNDEQFIGCGGSWNESWLEVATEFCRVDARVSNRVDRLRALGNAIVPEIAYQIFKAIEQAANKRPIRI